MVDITSFITSCGDGYIVLRWSTPQKYINAIRREYPNCKVLVEEAPWRQKV